MVAQVAGGDGITVTEHLLYMLVDELRIANWQRSKDGTKNRNKPKRVSPLARKQQKRIGGASVSQDQVHSALAALRPGGSGMAGQTHVETAHARG